LPAVSSGFSTSASDRAKLLQWDQNGFWLHYRRLDRGTFRLKTCEDVDGLRVTITRAQLSMLLEEIDFQERKGRPDNRASSSRLGFGVLVQRLPEPGLRARIRLIVLSVLGGRESPERHPKVGDQHSTPNSDAGTSTFDELAS
jgi:IS66 Orf2 like protein